MRTSTYNSVIVSCIMRYIQLPTNFTMHPFSIHEGNMMTMIRFFTYLFFVCAFFTINNRISKWCIIWCTLLWSLRTSFVCIFPPHERTFGRQRSHSSAASHLVFDFIYLRWGETAKEFALMKSSLPHLHLTTANYLWTMYIRVVFQKNI